MRNKTQIALCFTILCWGASATAEELVCEGDAPRFPQRISIYLDCSDSQLLGLNLRLSLSEAKRALGTSDEERAMIETCEISADSADILHGQAGRDRQQIIESFLNTCNRALNANTRVPTGIQLSESQRAFQKEVINMPTVPRELLNTRGAETIEKKHSEFKRYWEIGRDEKPNQAGLSSIKDWICVSRGTPASEKEIRSFQCEALGIIRSNFTVELDVAYKGRLYKGDVVSVSGRISRLGLDHANYRMTIRNATFDFVQISEWLSMAKEKGYRPNRLETNSLSASSSTGLPDDISQLMSLASQGNAEAQHKLGSIYLTEQSDADAAAKAFKWFQTAAFNGYAKAQYQLGMMYIEGTGIEADFAKAGRWLRMAADQGYPEAKLQLNALLQYGARKAFLQ